MKKYILLIALATLQINAIGGLGPRVSQLFKSITRHKASFSSKAKHIANLCYRHRKPITTTLFGIGGAGAYCLKAECEPTEENSNANVMTSANISENPANAISLDPNKLIPANVQKYREGSATLTFIEQEPFGTKHKLETLSHDGYLGTQAKVEALYRLTHEVIELEHSIHTQNRYSLLHGTTTQMHLTRKFFYQLRNDNDKDCFVSTQFTANKLLPEKKEKKREKTIRRGIDWGNHKQRKKVVFTGYSLLSGFFSESPIDYWAINQNCYSKFGELSDIEDNRLTIPKVFALFNATTAYRIFESKIDALNEEYQRVCPGGEILVFSFSPEAIEKWVYPANPLGSTNRYEGEYTNKDILNSLKTNIVKFDDDNRLIFCHISDNDPDVAGKEVKVHILTGADPEEMKKYMAKENALLYRIRKYIDDTRRWAEPTYMMETSLP